MARSAPGSWIDRVPGRDARRGHPAPEHAGLLQAPRRGGPVHRAHRPTASCWPNAPRASPRSRTPWPSATRPSASPAARYPRPRPWSGCCTPSWSGSPTTSTWRSGWPTRPGSRWPRPDGAAQGTGDAAGKPDVRQPVRPRRGGTRRGHRAARLSPAQILPPRLDKLGSRHRGRCRADGPLLFLDRLRGTGPLTPERAREHGALGPIGKAAGYADDNRLDRPYDAYPRWAWRRASRMRPGTHWPGCGSGGRRWTPSSVCFGGPPRKFWPNGPRICSGSPASHAAAARWAGPRLHKTISFTTFSWQEGRIVDCHPGRVIPQPGTDARGLHRQYPDRLPVHRGELRPVRRGVALSVSGCSGACATASVTTRWPAQAGCLRRRLARARAVRSTPADR